MDEHGVVHGLDQALKQLLTVVEARAAQLQVVQQLVDGRAETRELLALALQTQTLRRRLVAGQLPHLLRQLVDGTLLAIPSRNQGDQARGEDDRRD